HSGIQYDHSAKWRPVENPCEVCYCLEGHVRCEREQCHTPCKNPEAPPPNACCPVCQGANKSIHSSKMFNIYRDPCLHCRCSAGTVICHEEKCPPVQCSKPIIDPHLCCPICKGNKVQIRSHAGAPCLCSQWHPEGPCSSCTCVNGETFCTHSQCPPTDCLHPTKTTGSCCAVCESCTYNHRIYSNGQRFTAPDQPCHTCTCLHGTVECERRPCPPLNCTNSYTPHRECCPKCPDCSFENRIFVDGEAFPNPVSVCEECKCVSGRIDCHVAQCSHPHCNAPLPGTCCQNNCNGCSYGGKEYPNGQEFPHPTDKCRTCSCTNGNVQCLMKRCPPLPCSNPNVLPGECCPQCPAPPSDCEYEQRPYRHTEHFYHPTDNCRLCVCTNGTVRCQRKPCPFAPCSNPITQDCCRTCEGCLYEGRERANGETWDDPSDPCAVCMCRDGTVHCERKRCPPTNCKYPVQRQCCMSCDGCMYHGKEYPDGFEFSDDKDPCNVCYCYGGEVVCTKIPCYGDCSHPYTPPRQCCGECERCLYQGVTYIDGQVLPGEKGRCQECTCTVSMRRHELKPCPVQCSHPIPSDTCCPVCDSCLYEGVVHPHSHTFTPSNPCQRCTCAGEVQCAAPQCPKLPCMHQVTDPGACCPRCRGCMYAGGEHTEGSSWFADSTPCMTCMCVDGVTTCSEVRCLSPCTNFINVPGECCPVCADCIFEGQVYGPGDSFHPADDPCQICTCEQHLRCYRKQCPSLVDCPKSNILFTGPESCCPVCAQPLSNCTAALIGNEVLATDDPCFTCHCKDLTWTCLHQNCPPLTCPPNEQFFPPDSCCPVCKDSGASCLYQGVEYQSNERWDVDECTGCTCLSGDVHCHIERCPPLTCSTDEMPAVIPGLCCPHCLPRPATCIAFGDPHYRTFDGRMLHFQGACTYILAQDCEGGDFSIHATNDDRGRKGVSWTKEVTVFIGDVTVQLLQDWVVKVNDQVVTLPFLREPYIYVERQTNTILLNTNIGLKVLWSGRSHLEVSVPGSYRDHTCGLCGNFNNYHQDDLRMPSGKISQSESDFGNSWRVTNGSHSLSSCRPGEDVDPCKDAGYQAKKGANARCKVLKSSVFKPCHRVVPPEPWYGACVYDLCACGANTDECLCDTLEAYASQCREAGVVLQWRSPSLCAVGCPVERGFVFDECGPPCPITCFNVDVPLGVIESHCFKPCVPGCQCPAGLVLHNNYCIRPEKCPRIIHGKPT
uniref:Si:dkey-266m15.6 n=1 Tax=Sphaeramia orbicularis TaxID=375764 RepID=A0A673BRQ6_9TELE